MYVHIGWSFEHKLNVGRCEGVQRQHEGGGLGSEGFEKKERSASEWARKTRNNFHV
jgi:hypothetical protein